MRKSSNSNQGIKSNKNVRPGVKTGMPSRAMSPKGTSQIGSQIGSHAMTTGKNLTKGVEPTRGALKPPGSPGTIPLGNAVALNVGAGGPGRGRTTAVSGSQGCHGEVAGSARPVGRSFDS